jgi:nicotinamidase/pyrazinamidase
MNTFETPRTVVVGVDIQNDFIDGSLAVTNGEAVVTPFNRTAEVTRKVGGTVILTRDWHPRETPHFDEFGGTWPVHCVADTEGAAFHPDLVVRPEDTIISKGMGQTDGYSGWEGIADNGQTIETIVTPKDPTEKVRVFIGGLATDYCVKATALDIARTFETDQRVTAYLLRDAVRGVEVTAGDTDRALEEMDKAGIIALTTAEAIAIIEGGQL